MFQKRLITGILSSLLMLSGCLQAAADNTDRLLEQLQALPYVTSVNAVADSVFPSKYVLFFEQPVDHRHPRKGCFRQRVFLSVVHPDSLTLVVTEGYNVDYAAKNGYRSEISSLFNTNQAVIEHRYFKESCPETLDWDFLTTANAAADQHRVVSSLRQLFPSKWIATGISKGGQTCAMYRYYYPKDVDITVPYVAPFCRSLEDGRHEPFIRYYCGTPEQRRQIEDFQLEVLRRRERLMPLFDSLCVADHLQFWLPTDQIYDYCVLEFSFAFWQWGNDPADIPSTDASDRDIFDYWADASGPDYLVNNSKSLSFHVQSAKELGYYGYDTRPFEEYLHIQSSKDYSLKIFLPQRLDDGTLTLGEGSDGCFSFDGRTYRRMRRFLQKTDARMLFIYGQFDPWSAVAAEDFWSESVAAASVEGAAAVAEPCKGVPKGIERDNLRIFIQPQGSHRTRIATFDPDTHDEIVQVLRTWLAE